MDRIRLAMSRREGLKAAAACAGIFSPAHRDARAQSAAPASGSAHWSAQPTTEVLREDQPFVSGGAILS